jgi:RNA polymerase sigma factor (sigma-70 family)
VKRLEVAAVINLSGLSDVALVAAIRLHPDGAFAELERRYLTSVSAAARAVLGNRAECADVVAEVFELFWQLPDRFDPSRGQLVGYLRSQARRRAIDLLRSESARATRERRYVQLHWVTGPPSELREAASRSLAALPSDERRTVELAYFCRMTYREVAEYLGEPEGTVKSRIRRALTRMRTTTLSCPGSEAAAG